MLTLSVLLFGLLLLYLPFIAKEGDRNRLAARIRNVWHYCANKAHQKQEW